MRRLALIALLPLLFACPDKKPAQADNELERIRERTNTNIDHPTQSPLEHARETADKEAERVKERTNNNEH